MLFVVFFFVLIVVNQNVNCTVIQFVHDKFFDFTSYFARTTETIYDKVKDFFETHLKLDNNKFTRNTEIDWTTERRIPTERIVRLGEIESEKPEFVNLGLEPVRFFGTPQLAFWHGHNMESHMVRTEDGFSLCLHRITTHPFPPANKTVLLHHGLLGSSTDWILLGAKKSLPYFLSNAGYDVWIANARGNYFSRGHSSMTVGFTEYWNFSFHEMGVTDLPAVVNYIRKTRNSNETINYIGHSMGGTALLVLLSSQPEYQKYFRIGILMAPLAFMNHVEGPLKELANIEEFTSAFGETEFLRSRKVPNALIKRYCKGPLTFCSNPLLFLCGIPTSYTWSPSFIARMLYHVPAGGSTKTILHYLQIIKNKKFHKFNEPSEEYNIKNISLPIALFSSSDDWLASIPDVLKLYFSLRNPIDHHIIRGRNMTHTDFVWGPEANIIVFAKILEYLEKGLEWRSVTDNEVKQLNY